MTKLADKEKAMIKLQEDIHKANVMSVNDEIKQLRIEQAINDFFAFAYDEGKKEGEVIGGNKVLDRQWEAKNKRQYA